jgi:hypothetical protein
LFDLPTKSFEFPPSFEPRFLLHWPAALLRLAGVILCSEDFQYVLGD